MRELINLVEGIAIEQELDERDMGVRHVEIDWIVESYRLHDHSTITSIEFKDRNEAWSKAKAFKRAASAGIGVRIIEKTTTSTVVKKARIL